MGFRIVARVIGLAVPCALSFSDIPFAMVGGAYIIMAAFIVRSLPASVRSGWLPCSRSIHRSKKPPISWGGCPIHLPQGHPAADPASSVCRPDLQLHPPYDQPVGDHFPGQRQMEDRDRLHPERMGTGRGEHRPRPTRPSSLSLS